MISFFKLYYSKKIRVDTEKYVSYLYYKRNKSENLKNFLFPSPPLFFTIVEPY